jgi:tetratricopeptide (TPR) repeat protein
VSDNPRIEDLRRRVEKDPASIAFAQLAEEYRRSGRCEEAVGICRAGLDIHPGYLSARVTLGRALVELERFDEAQIELDLVLRSAPENLAAIRGLAEIYHRRGELPQALAQYRAALALARNDPDLEQTVEDLARQLTPRSATTPQDGLTVEQMQQEMAAKMPSLHVAVSPRPDPPAPAVKEEPAPPPAPRLEPAAPQPPLAAVAPPPAPRLEPVAPQPLFAAAAPPPAPLPAPVMMRSEPRGGARVEPAPPAFEDAADRRAARTLAALDQWLTALHVARPDRCP